MTDKRRRHNGTALLGAHVKEEKPMPRLLILTLLTCLALSPAIRSAASDEPGVVFHLDSDTSMNRMLAQVARHHAFNPGIETRVILIGNGVKPALEGAKDANGGQYSAQMEQLMASGIRIFACEATLNYYSLTEDNLAFGVETVPSGVAALGRLQASEGWGYIKL
ncbi:DsrE family protein [Luminiphilus sp.]|nr:DsrE family protein [Luminiphilus sp.]MDA9711053.1 DsrE family protein [Luminiphilus sp.]